MSTQTKDPDRQRPIFAAIVVLGVFAAYLWRLGNIPAGFFADEAMIGYRAYQVLHGDLTNVTPFFYGHFRYTLGSLPVYTTLPFVAIFGLNEFAVRLASVVYALLSLAVIYAILRKTRAAYPAIAVLILAFTPLFFHVSRINFGHLCSLFFVVLGYYFYVRADKEGSDLWSIASGLSIGIGAYGYGTFMLTSALLVLAIAVVEIIPRAARPGRTRRVVLILIVFSLVYLPIVLNLLFNPAFLTRLAEKSGDRGSLLSLQRLKEMGSNYLKYFGYAYLFSKGEIDHPGSVTTRHTIRGNGILLSMTLPLVILGCVAILTRKDRGKKYYMPSLLLLFVYPLPDLITTKSGKPPYSFSLFAMIYLLPFLIAYAIDSIAQSAFVKKHSVRLLRTQVWVYIILGTLFCQASIFMRNYAQYPLYSSDFCGWQYGPRQIIAYLQQVDGGYDDLIMSEQFNMGDVFFKFYTPDGCVKCREDDHTLYSPDRKQLFALRPAELEKQPFTYMIVHSIRYPNGEVAFQVVEPLAPRASPTDGGRATVICNGHEIAFETTAAE